MVTISPSQKGHQQNGQVPINFQKDYEINENKNTTKKPTNKNTKKHRGNVEAISRVFFGATYTPRPKWLPSVVASCSPGVVVCGEIEVEWVSGVVFLHPKKKGVIFSRMAGVMKGELKKVYFCEYPYHPWDWNLNLQLPNKNQRNSWIGKNTTPMDLMGYRGDVFLCEFFGRGCSELQGVGRNGENI